MGDVKKETRLPIEQAQDVLGALASDLRNALARPGMTIRNVAAFTGVDKSTVLRAKQGKPISAEAYIALSSWLVLRQPDTSEGGGETAGCTCEMLPPGFHMDACPMHKRSSQPVNKFSNPEHVEGDVLSVGAWGYLAEGLRSHARSIDMECAPEESDLWQAADALSAAQSSIQRAERERGLPRLTSEMIYAAACGHYGKKRVDAASTEGISMTVDGTDYSFNAAFRRMWAGVRAHLRRDASASLGEKQDAE